MHSRLLILLSIFYFFKCSQSAKINSEHDATAIVESLKSQLQELEAEVQKQYETGKLKWQLQAFQKWYQDAEKCSRDLSYIFDGWTIVQRRMDGTENFQKNWREYSQGFGDSQKDFFIGLEKLHELTTGKGPQELLILLGDHEGKIAYARYQKFVLAGEKEKYELKELGDYEGDAGDSLRYHVGKKFSTFDQDNNDEIERCSKVWTGGWWFDACFESNLNGNYILSKTGAMANKGIIWKDWHGMRYSLKFVQMMIRPKE